jgi:hypothetical protein
LKEDVFPILNCESGLFHLPRYIGESLDSLRRIGSPAPSTRLSEELSRSVDSDLSEKSDDIQFKGVGQGRLSWVSAPIHRGGLPAESGSTA